MATDKQLYAELYEANRQVRIVEAKIENLTHCFTSTDAEEEFVKSWCSVDSQSFLEYLPKNERSYNEWKHWETMFMQYRIYQMYLEIYPDVSIHDLCMHTLKKELIDGFKPIPKTEHKKKTNKTNKTKHKKKTNKTNKTTEIDSPIPEIVCAHVVAKTGKHCKNKVKNGDTMCYLHKKQQQQQHNKKSDSEPELEPVSSDSEPEPELEPVSDNDVDIGNDSVPIISNPSTINVLFATNKCVPVVSGENVSDMTLDNFKSAFGLDTYKPELVNWKNNASHWPSYNFRKIQCQIKPKNDF